MAAATTTNAAQAINAGGSQWRTGDGGVGASAISLLYDAARKQDNPITREAAARLALRGHRNTDAGRNLGRGRHR